MPMSVKLGDTRKVHDYLIPLLPHTYYTVYHKQSLELQDSLKLVEYQKEITTQNVSILEDTSVSKKKLIMV